jgi:predicted ATP-dependent endonuclease of OLD family
MLHRNLSNKDKSSIHKAYDEFFEHIKKAESFKKAFNYIEHEEIKNIEDFVKQIKLIPNLPNLKNIFTNITIGYGDDYLFQKGLGTRNFLLLMILFSYYYEQKKTYNLICVEEPESHLCVNNFNLFLDFMTKSADVQSSLSQILVSSHNPKIINKLKLSNVIVFSNDKVIDFSSMDKTLVNYMAKRPNFDTLKLLFSKRIVLVEGPTEEMFINTLLSKELDKISEIEVLAVGHKGFRLYMDIWLEFNKGNKNVKLGVIRDYDNQDNAKQNHEKYDNENINIMVRTTENYTFEDDLANIEDNREALYRYYDIENNSDEVSKYLKKNKTLNMLELCMEITDNSINLKPPQHIKEVIEWIIK